MIIPYLVAILSAAGQLKSSAFGAVQAWSVPDRPPRSAEKAPFAGLLDHLSD